MPKKRCDDRRNDTSRRWGSEASLPSGSRTTRWSGPGPLSSQPFGEAVVITERIITLDQHLDNAITSAVSHLTCPEKETYVRRQ